jgi:hypothetical protein
MCQKKILPNTYIIVLFSKVTTVIVLWLVGRVGHDPKPYRKQLSELRYSGIRTDRTPSLLEVIR